MTMPTARVRYVNTGIGHDTLTKLRDHLRRLIAQILTEVETARPVSEDGVRLFFKKNEPFDVMPDDIFIVVEIGITERRLQAKDAIARKIHRGLVEVLDEGLKFEVQVRPVERGRAKSGG